MNSKNTCIALLLFCFVGMGHISLAQCNAYFGIFQSQNTVYFIDSSSGSYTQWLWDFGDGDSDSVANPVHVFDSVGTYNVCLTVTDTAMATSCTDTYCGSIVIVCNAEFTYALGQGNVVSFTDASFGNSEMWAWDFGDGAVDSTADPQHTYLVTGSYYVCVTVSDSALNCSDTFCDNVNVTCAGNFGFSVQMDNSVNFQDLTLGNPVSWHWDFGDGDTSNLENPSHVFLPDSVYYVCLTWNDSLGTCTGTVCDSVPVGINNGTCSAGYTINNLGLGFVQFTNTSTGNLTGYLWDFGDGTTSTAANPGFHTFPFMDVYTVCLTVVDSTNWCFDTYCDVVDLTNGPVCTADFLTSVNFLDVNFINTSNTSGGLIILWNWDFGDGSAVSTAKNPSHSFASAGSYDVCLSFIRVDPPACNSNTVCKTIIVEENTTGSENLISTRTQENVVSVFPNPVTNKGMITYSLTAPSPVSVVITDIAGCIVESISLDTKNAGNHPLEFSTEHLSPGIYFVRLTSSDGNSIAKFAAIK